MPFAVSVVDYDGSLRDVARGKRGKWQVKEIDSIDDTLFFRRIKLIRDDSL